VSAGGIRSGDPTDGAFGAVFSARQVARVRELLARLYNARRMIRFYPSDHPAVGEALAGLMATIRAFHAEGADVPLTFFEDELLLGDQLLPEDSVMFDQLIRDMMSIGAGSVTFRAGLDESELERAVRVLSLEVGEVLRAGGLERAVAVADLPHVTFATVTIVEKESEEETDAVPGRGPARRAYSAALDLMRELERVIQRQESLGAGRIRGVARSLVENVLSNRFAMLELSGLKDHDEYTFYHSVNVSVLSLAVGSAITHDLRFLSSLGVGSLLHDIGKMTVDLEILNKPGALTSHEWADVRRHPVLGAETAASIPGLDRSSVVVALEHHMRFDLTGYPARKPERRQHLASRIVAIADAYDAMTSRRAYSAARLQDEAMSILLRNAGSAFDPALVRSFVRIMGIYPPRAVVRLTTGETAVVLAPDERDVARPTVRVFADAAGVMIDPFDVSLADEGSGRSVERCLDEDAINVDVEEYL